MPLLGFETEEEKAEDRAEAEETRREESRAVRPDDFGADPEEITREVVQGRVGEENLAARPVITNIGQVAPEEESFVPALGLEPLRPVQPGQRPVGFRDVSPGSLRNISDPGGFTKQEEFLRSQSGIPIPEGTKRISPPGPFGSGTPADFAAGRSNRLVIRGEPREADSPGVQSARVKAAENITRRQEQGAQIQDQLGRVAEEERNLEDQRANLPSGQNLRDLEFFAEKGRAVGTARESRGGFGQQGAPFASVLDANAIAKKAAGGGQLTNREAQFLKRQAAAQNIIGRVEGIDADMDFLTGDRSRLEQAMQRFQGLPELETPDAAGSRVRGAERTKAAQNIARTETAGRGKRITRLKERQRTGEAAVAEFDKPGPEGELSQADQIRARVIAEERAKLGTGFRGKPKTFKKKEQAAATKKATAAVEAARQEIRKEQGLGGVSARLKAEQGELDVSLFGDISVLNEPEQTEFEKQRAKPALSHVADEDIIAEIIRGRQGN